MPSLDRSHDPGRRSWLASANAAGSDFPIQNLPYGVFSVPGRAPRAGVAIGDAILDLAVVQAAGLLPPVLPAGTFAEARLNAFMALGPAAWQAMRLALSDLLEAASSRLRDDAPLRAEALVPAAAATLHLPFFVRSFTDFYASREHATNVGALLRGRDNALMPNWLHLPVGYNGRASTVVVSGTPVVRPLGQMKPADSDAPVFGPCQRLDFELELGAIVGTPSPMGTPLTVAEAQEMIFGFVLLNDWSARDIQAWEYVPLGPFQSKAFATTISPWIVTRAALEPFRLATPERARPLLPYLVEPAPLGYDIELSATLTPRGAAGGTVLCRTNYRHMYYSPAQQLAHHAIGGCAMCTGDLLGSGTVSGPTRDGLGSLIEITEGGKQAVALDGGGSRTFLEDGDTLTLAGWSEREGVRIGFGTCAGTIRPSPPQKAW